MAVDVSSPCFLTGLHRIAHATGVRLGVRRDSRLQSSQGLIKTDLCCRKVTSEPSSSHLPCKVAAPPQLQLEMEKADRLVMLIGIWDAETERAEWKERNGGAGGFLAAPVIK